MPDQSEIEAAVLSVLVPLNEVLQDLADRGRVAALLPAGHLYEAHIFGDLLRPEEKT